MQRSRLPCKLARHLTASRLAAGAGPARCAELQVSRLCTLWRSGVYRLARWLKKQPHSGCPSLLAFEAVRERIVHPSTTRNLPKLQRRKHTDRRLRTAGQGRVFELSLRMLCQSGIF